MAVDERLYDGYVLTMAKETAREHRLLSNGETWFSPSKKQVRNYRLCEGCARKIDTMIDNTIRTFGKYEQTVIG